MNEHIEDDKETLLKHVPQNGLSIGNVTLRKQLRWDEERYWQTRDALVDEQKISLGRGKGGSVRRVEAATVISSGVSIDGPGKGGTEETDEHIGEESLYGKIETVLREKWGKEFRLQDSFFVQTTAKQGRHDTGGKWSRPDLIVVSVQSFQNLPGKFVDITTFEVKTHDNFDLTAVYEALAHLRAANRAYLLISRPRHLSDDLEERVESVAEEASRHGIGLIVAHDVTSYAEWHFRVDPQVNQPEPARLDEFLETQVSAENKKQLHRWLK